MLSINVPSLDELGKMSNHDLYFHYCSIKNQFGPLIENIENPYVKRRKIYKSFYNSLINDALDEINLRKADNRWGSGWGI